MGYTVTCGCCLLCMRGLLGTAHVWAFAKEAIWAYMCCSASWTCFNRFTKRFEITTQINSVIQVGFQTLCKIYLEVSCSKILQPALEPIRLQYALSFVARRSWMTPPPKHTRTSRWSHPGQKQFTGIPGWTRASS